jgi:hypothetical protein
MATTCLIAVFCRGFSGSRLPFELEDDLTAEKASLTIVLPLNDLGSACFVPTSA